MTLITYEDLTRWRACYLQDERRHVLRRLFAVPVTIRDVLTRRDGEWMQIPDQDRLWVATRNGILDAATLRLTACDTAEFALENAKNYGYVPDPILSTTIQEMRRYAAGLDSAATLQAAWAAVARIIKMPNDSSAATVWAVGFTTAGSAATAALQASRVAADSAAAYKYAEILAAESNKRCDVAGEIVTHTPIIEPTHPLLVAARQTVWALSIANLLKHMDATSLA